MGQSDGPGQKWTFVMKDLGVIPAKIKVVVPFTLPNYVIKAHIKSTYESQPVINIIVVVTITIVIIVIITTIQLSCSR